MKKKEKKKKKRKKKKGKKTFKKQKPSSSKRKKVYKRTHLFENKFKKAEDPNVLQESCEENCHNVSRICVQEYEKTSKPKTLAGSLAPAIMQGSREGRYELALAVERRDTCGGLWFVILWFAQRPEAAGGSARD